MTWLTIGSFALKYWKYILASATALAMGLWIAWQVQDLRTNKLKTQNSKLKTENSECQKANEENLKTIEKLKSEISNSQRLCRERLRVKEKTINKLREIDAIDSPLWKRGARGDFTEDKFQKIPLNPPLLKGEEMGETDENDIGIVDDPVMRELNRMFDKTDSQN
jgi:hypothetical protein